VLLLVVADRYGKYKRGLEKLRRFSAREEP
jgi:hypothetical protein